MPHLDACDGLAGVAVLLGGEARKVLGIAQANSLPQEINDRPGLQEGGCCHVHIQSEASLRGSEGLLVAQPNLQDRW